MADNTTLYTTADTFVVESIPGGNYGTLSLLVLATRQTSEGRRSFLKFDLSSLPAGVAISLAKFRLYCYTAVDLVAGVTDVEVRRVADDSWAEEGITWTNQKAYGAIEDTKVPAVGWVEWDVLSFIQDEYAGDKTVSLCLKCKVESYDSTNRYSYYRSREYNSLDPELYIEYTPPIDYDHEAAVDVGIDSTASRRCVYHRYGWRP